MNSFSIQIQNWYLENKRDLPWRNTVNPYKIWLSEIILQQTRVEQGMNYFLAFEKEFPTIIDLANASEQKVLRLWQGLGYYSRARNLHYTAKHIANEFGGVFPETYDEIIKLKGVGPYSASAISSFAFKEVKAVVDGNVFRVLARYFNHAVDINSTQGKKDFQNFANELIDSKNPDIHNQAIMELGSLVCTPKNPSCETCPVNNSCEGFAKKTMLELPVKIKKIKIKNLFLNYLVYKNDDKTIVKQRSNQSIWANMYDFPAVEFSKKSEHLKFEPEGIIISKKEMKVHKLSHRNIYACFWELEADQTQQLKNEDFIEIKIEEIDDLPKSRLVDKYLEESFLFDAK